MKQRKVHADEELSSRDSVPHALSPFMKATGNLGRKVFPFSDRLLDTEVEGVAVTRGIRVLLGMSIALAVSLPAGALPQAAAESALTNAISSSATVNGASVLNHSLNKATERLAGRIQEPKAKPDPVQLQRRKPEVRSHIGGNAPKGSGASVTPNSIIAIQGAEVTCPKINSPTPKSKPKAEPTATNCPNGDIFVGPEVQGKYPSAINLSFPK